MTLAEPKQGIPLGDLLISLGVMGLGGYFVYGALQIDVAQTYARVGPRFFPFLVAFGLLLCGALLFVQALRGQTAEPEEAEDADADVPVDYRAVGIIGVALALYVLLLETCRVYPRLSGALLGRRVCVRQPRLDS